MHYKTIFNVAKWLPRTNRQFSKAFQQRLLILDVFINIFTWLFTVLRYFNEKSTFNYNHFLIYSGAH
ncbi:conserved protein of unknown function [Lactiplantibacillus plantarum]|uniref:Uncharacterized protein n=1 Tax=Lactiplantibacillus plantarum TaxID=1590 RepID=A0A165R1R5_LACPN|nr:hypothetical protein FC76_GL001235 [Lactiplantibacillus plantarum subsp. plantarum ATCC 14917 = JCM 1149 = CGMCC 1.2437]KZU37116.1 hypothetical protein Nizo2741_2048 [Lactiplantibacillus plantarum]KZU60050.1 hypothetical protein Nizo2806_1457 [Lactiplantibacillus plantarum]KZU76191.1 hypothetical protein Nizo2889_0755 [Lactiplantibacillus plantarum]KZU91854.1 hypothetical protein Lp19_3140 [Lactiplantibacillus plantarum]